MTDSPRDDSPREGSPRGNGPTKKKLRLDQFLKLRGMVSTGGEAKIRIQGGEVTLNGEVCTQRGRGLRVGDTICLDGNAETVNPELFESYS